MFNKSDAGRDKKNVNMRQLINGIKISQVFFRLSWNFQAWFENESEYAA